MQRKPTRRESHPAEALASAVFVTCCRTLGALRVPQWISNEPSVSDPDAEYQKSWQEYLKNNDPFLQDGMEHPIDYVDWHDMLGRMNRLTFNHRRYKPLAYQHKMDLQHAALYHPLNILPLAVRHSTAVVDLLNITRRESPSDAAQPFTLAKVIGWLSEMDLVSQEGDRIQAKATCFESSPRLRFTGLSLATLRKVGDWVTGPLAPPARELDFHLMDADGKPGMAREVLYIQGMSAPHETHIALLHVLPTWSKPRRLVLMDLILASWIRAVEVYGNSSTFKSECAAGIVYRWQEIRRYVAKIPTAQTHTKGSSAGFTSL